jgi:outer membrane biosynthesis protein TonB
MTPQSQPPEESNSSKTNLLISFVFHAVLVAIVIYFAARQGFLGHQLQKITVEMIKEKPPEPPKPPPKPPVEVPKPEPPKVAVAPKPVEATKAEAPPSAAPPTVAPPPAELPSFDFDGGKSVISSTDPVEIYRSAIETAFRSKWNRPENMADDNYFVDVQVSIRPDGEIGDVQWQKGSGNSAWDESVRRAIASVKSMDNLPPTNFPPYVMIRFDVQEDTEPVLQ